MKRYFERSIPEEQGVHSTAIMDFLSRVEGIGYQLHSFLMLRHGKVIAEVCKYPFCRDHKRLVYSVSKTFTSTAIGIAVEEGLLNVKDRVITFFPEHENLNLDQRVRSITVENLLMMATGHGMDSISAMCDGDDDWARTFFTREMVYDPGEKFVYDSGGTYMLSEILTRITGQSMDQYLEEKLFKPLEISDFSWDKHGTVNTGAWGVLALPEDLAKLGSLYLGKGVFNHKRILTEEWVERASSGLISTSEEYGIWGQAYGYQIWRTNAASYRADGAFGQFCMVFPEEDVVIVTTAEEADSARIFPLVEKYLLSSLSNMPYRSDPIVYGQLKKAIAAWETPLIYTPTESYMEQLIDGKAFVLSENDNQRYKVIFQICNSEMELHIDDIQTIRSSNISYTYGQSVYSIMPPSVSPILAEPQSTMKWQYAAHHEWVNDRTLLLTIWYPETGHRQQWMFLFLEDTIEVIISNSCKRLFGLIGLKSNRSMAFGDIILRGRL